MIAAEANASRVRLATRHDEGALLDFVRREHAENGIGEMSEHKVLNVIRRGLDPLRNDPVVIGIAGELSIEGSICLVVEQPWYGDEPYLMAVWNYVLYEFRNSTHAKDLIAFAKHMSLPSPGGIGLPLHMDVAASARTEAQIKMLKRQLGEPMRLTWVCGVGDNARVIR